MNLSSGCQLKIVEFSTFSLNIIILNKEIINWHLNIHWEEDLNRTLSNLYFAEGLFWWPIQNHASTISLLSNISMYLTINFLVKLTILNLGIKIIFQNITMSWYNCSPITFQYHIQENRKMYNFSTSSLLGSLYCIF